MSTTNICPKCGTDAHYIFEGETQCPDCDRRDFEAPMLQVLYRDALPTEVAERPAGTCSDCYDGLVCSMEENYEESFRDSGVNVDDRRVWDIIRLLAHEYANDQARTGFENLCTRCEDEAADRINATENAERILFHTLDLAIEAETAGDIDAMRAHLDMITRAAKAAVVPVYESAREEIASYAADMLNRHAIDAAQDAGFLF